MYNVLFCESSFTHANDDMLLWVFLCVFFVWRLYVHSQLFLFVWCKLLCCICILHQILLSCILISKLEAPFFSHIFFVDTHVFLLHEVLSHYHLKFLFWNCSLWLCMHFLLQFYSIGTLMLLRACITSICVCGWLHGLVFWNTLVIFLA